DVFPILEACGRHALPLPLAQTMVARALLSSAGRSAPAGSIALTTSCAANGSAVLVSYGAVADQVLLADGPWLTLLDANTAVREPLDEGSTDAWLTWPADALAKEPFRIESSVDLRSVEACLLAGQMSGAMRQVLRVTLQYANERTQFGRSIGKFQAIQHQLSVMAEHTEAGRMAARMACATRGIIGSPLLSAVAKARTSEAAALVASIAHAVHGAIGITEEYDLQLCTRRLHAWRVAAGAESYWNMRIGRALLASRHVTVPEFVRHELSAAPVVAAGT
ncbi:MAG TPA: acyl-CoA dehydrogenase family protein, partial [Burkholderiaceae bacterium]|nr:acyl-CoA dehydrogenase family protein [Burkholderiaceae bacterium]